MVQPIKYIHGSHLSRVSEFLFFFFRWNRTVWKLGNFFQKKTCIFWVFWGVPAGCLGVDGIPTGPFSARRPSSLGHWGWSKEASVPLLDVRSSPAEHQCSSQMSGSSRMVFSKSPAGFELGSVFRIVWNYKSIMVCVEPLSKLSKLRSIPILLLGRRELHEDLFRSSGAESLRCDLLFSRSTAQWRPWTDVLLGLCYDDFDHRRFAVYHATPIPRGGKASCRWHLQICICILEVQKKDALRDDARDEVLASMVVSRCGAIQL